MREKNDYRYNSCTSRGICSVNPKTASLMQILLLYLKNSAYYALKLYDFGVVDEKIKYLILNTISMTVSNPEFSERDFCSVAANFKNELPRIIAEYKDICSDKNVKPDFLKENIQFEEAQNIIKTIQQGEKEFYKKTEKFSVKKRNLYELILILAKSLCTNILNLETYGEFSEQDYICILELMNSFNFAKSEKNLKKLILKAANHNTVLMRKIRTIQTERYGKQHEAEVSYSTTPGKAVLVVGSNIRELEFILDALKDEEIDVYTHDEMMLAHTFPKFKEYTHLKGQFGQGMDSCLLDFSTFPGPIILTRHSLFNVEHLYRGHLYTTDIAYSKGVVQILNNDYSDVIKCAKNSAGFKSGKSCQSDMVGFNYDNTFSVINSAIESNKYKQVIIIGLSGYNDEINNYFSRLINIVTDDIFVITLSYCKKSENFLCLNGCFDSYASFIIPEYISEKFSIKTNIFFPYCDKNTISKAVYFSEKIKSDVFIGECEPVTMNPNLFSTLNEEFNIKKIKTPRKDFESIIV